MSGTPSRHAIRKDGLQLTEEYHSRMRSNIQTECIRIVLFGLARDRAGGDSLKYCRFVWFKKISELTE
jgi:hypothetical protein